MAFTEYPYRDAAALEATVAESLRGVIAEALAARPHAQLALAGGRTPLPLYRRLAQAGLDWSRVWVVPTDERCVPHDHPACNLRALKEAWSAAAGIGFVALTPADGDAERAEAFAQAALAPYPDPFDLVLLGMGNDTHTASLFPGAPQLATALAPDAPPALRIDPVPLPAEAPFPRISLSAVRLAHARHVLLLTTGADKREAMRRAQQSDDPLATPVAALMHAEESRLHIHWSP